jgi:hypothetical protein
MKYFRRSNDLWEGQHTFQEENIDIKFTNLYEPMKLSEGLVSLDAKIEFEEGHSSWEKRFNGEIDFSLRIRDFQILAGPAVITKFDCKLDQAVCKNITDKIDMITKEVFTFKYKRTSFL